MDRDFQRNQNLQSQSYIGKGQDVAMASQGGNFPEDSSQNLQQGKNSVNNNNSATIENNENSRSVGKRKYIKRAPKKNDVCSQGSGGKDKKQGRWTLEEKQKFIDGKFQFFKSRYLEPLQNGKFEFDNFGQFIYQQGLSFPYFVAPKLASGILKLCGHSFCKTCPFLKPVIVKRNFFVGIKLTRAVNKSVLV